MSAHIPEFRRAIMGRTHAQAWQPEAIEHHRAASREWVRWAGYIGCIFIALIGLHAVARFFGG